MQPSRSTTEINPRGWWLVGAQENVMEWEHEQTAESVVVREAGSIHNPYWDVYSVTEDGKQHDIGTHPDRETAVRHAGQYMTRRSD